MRRFEADREMSAQEADTLVGTKVGAHEAPDVTEEGIWWEGDEPILAYAPLPMPPAEVAAVRQAAIRIPWSTTYRGSGMRNKSRTFGMAPRLAMRQRDSCRPTSLYSEHPDIHAHLDRTADALAAWVRRELPEVDAEDRRTVGPVLPEWRVGEETIWTSGVVNLTSELPYHRDGANFQAWSAMPVFRRGTRGGRLHLPEFGLSVECRDGWVVYFAGWKYVHGVTPIRKEATDGYRISIVYYSLRGMKDCHTFAVETAQGNARRTQREDRMLRTEPESDALW